MNLRTNNLMMIGTAAAMLGLGSAANGDLIARYTLDETTGTSAADSAGDATDHGGILQGTTFDAGSVAGVFGNALSLNGSTDRVRLEGGGAVQGSTGALALTNWTLSTWFYKTGDGSGNQDNGGGGIQGMNLIAKGTGENDSGTVETNYALGLHQANNGDWLVAGDFEDVGASPNNNLVTGTTVIQDNQWYHAALTYDGANLRVYVDGTLEVTFGVTDLPELPTAQPAALGAGLQSNGSGRGHFQGYIDEARIYDEALTDQEIAALAVVPEPTSLALIAMGSAMMLRRRR